MKGQMFKMIGNAKVIIDWLLEQDKEQQFEITELRQKRSLTANAYYWSLLNQLANVLRFNNEKLHFVMLQRYGQYEVISVLSSIDITGYFKYYEAIGNGEIKGKQFTHYKVYKGSSQMDSKEFATLLDGLVSECEEQGIPTLARDERAQLQFIEGCGY